MNNQLPATKPQYHRESTNTNNQSSINTQSPMTEYPNEKSCRKAFVLLLKNWLLIGAWLLVIGYLLVIDVWLLVITRL